MTGRSNGDSYGYDANGNMISRTEGGQGYSQSFDAENRLAGVSGAGSASFVYDGDGTLVKQTVGTVTTKYYFPTWEVQNGTLIKSYLLGGKRVAVRQGCDLFYLHTDHLGSTSLVTTSDGSVQGRQRAEERVERSEERVFRTHSSLLDRWGALLRGGIGALSQRGHAGGRGHQLPDAQPLQLCAQ